MNTATETDIITRLEKHIEIDCVAVDLADRYERTLSEIYGNSVNVCGMEMDPVRILKEMDPTAFRCGCNDCMDSEIGKTITQEINGEHYDKREAEEAKEEFLGELQGELRELELELEDMEEEASEEGEPATESDSISKQKTKIIEKQAEIDAVESHSF